MNLPSSPVFRPDNFPDSDPLLLEALTRAMRELYDAVRSVPSTEILTAKAFVTESSGSAYVDIKNPLTGRPKDVHVAEIRLADGTSPDVVTNHAFSWQIKGEMVRCLFVGLTPSTKYQASVSIS